MPNIPLFSVITVVLNDRAGIRDTLRSAMAQQCDFEGLVVDGKSTDGTLEEVQNTVDARYRIFSEPDRGIYDAMNKGVARASGEYVVFMNSGDQFADNNVLSAFARAIESGHDLGVVYGDTLVMRGERRILKASFSPDLLWKGMVFYHQSCATRRELLLRYPFELGTLAADHRLFLRLRHEGIEFKRVERVCSLYRAGGVSDLHRHRVLKEFYANATEFRAKAQIELVVHYGFRHLLELAKKVAKQVLAVIHRASSRSSASAVAAES